jgi:hypothetical protein
VKALHLTQLLRSFLINPFLTAGSNVNFFSRGHQSCVGKVSWSVFSKTVSPVLLCSRAVTKTEKITDGANRHIVFSICALIIGYEYIKTSHRGRLLLLVFVFPSGVKG